MQPQEIFVADLVTAQQGSLSGPVSVEGWLVVENGERGWLAASHETVPTAVVHLGQPKEIYDLLMDSRVSPLGGGPYAYVNRATLTGSLGLSDNDYVITDVDEIAVCETVHLWLKPISPLKKKTDD